MKRFLRQAGKWALILFAALVLLLILVHIEEDWRGAHDWAAAQKELEAKGESLDLRQLVPPGKPEDDLSKVPIFAEQYKIDADFLEFRRRGGVSTFGPDSRNIKMHRVGIGLGLQVSQQYPKWASYLRGESIDLGAYQEFYRTLQGDGLSGSIGTPAQDVLKALSQIDPQMDEIEVALSNPKAYWPINYDFPQNGDFYAPTRLL